MTQKDPLDEPRSNTQVDDHNPTDERAPADGAETPVESHTKAHQGDVDLPAGRADSEAEADAEAEAGTQDYELESSESPAPPAKPAKPPKPVKRSRGGGLALLLSLLALAGVGILGYLGWEYTQRENQQLRAQLDERMAGIESAVQTTLDGEVQDLSGRVNQGLSEIQATRKSLASDLDAVRRTADPRPLVQPLQQKVAAAEARLEALVNDQRSALSQVDQRINAQQQRLINLSTTSREDWLLAEAEYLLRLANQRVLIEREPRKPWNWH